MEPTTAPPPLSGLVLDIGGDVGAVVVLLDQRPASGELDARPLPPGDAADGFHTGVHAREVGGAPVWTAVYPEVHAGGYAILDAAGAVLAEVEVTGGAVTEVDLRGG